MKNNDEILKYLSGILSDSEKLSFEERLNTSEELNKEFLEIKEKLSGLNPESFGEDERYFVNLIPRVRMRIDSTKGKSFSRYIYFAVPALTLLIIAVLYFPNKQVNMFENNYQELAEVVVNNFDDADVQNKYFNEIPIDPNYSLLANNNEYSIDLESAVNKIPDNYLNMVDYSNSETYHSLKNLSDDDLNMLYKELNEFKIQ